MQHLTTLRVQCETIIDLYTFAFKYTNIYCAGLQGQLQLFLYKWLTVFQTSFTIHPVVMRYHFNQFQSELLSHSYSYCQSMDMNFSYFSFCYFSAAIIRWQNVYFFAFLFPFSSHFNKYLVVHNHWFSLQLQQRDRFSIHSRQRIIQKCVIGLVRKLQEIQWVSQLIYLFKKKKSQANFCNCRITTDWEK